MNHSHKTWLLVADSTLCRIYDYTKDQITPVQEISHPENKLKDSEIVSDGPGRYKAGAAYGTFSPDTDPKEVLIDDYCRELAKLLDKAKNAHEYEHLIIVAGPHVNGLLFKHLNKEVKNLITHKLEKDFIHLNKNDLLSHVNKLLD